MYLQLKISRLGETLLSLGEFKDQDGKRKNSPFGLSFKSVNFKGFRILF